MGLDKQGEILAPVSNFEMLEAAIHNGADAVYIGMPGFNARGRSDQLSLEQLDELISHAHLYGVYTYIAFNIVIFEKELGRALGLCSSVAALNPDGWIVQEPGLASLIKKMVPGVRVHASTQASIGSHYDIELYKSAGFTRFTLSRELSVKEIAVIRNHIPDLELEVFVHGSLCIAYSGQCFTSSGFGGRSANRGECAQSCRHEYELKVDGTLQSRGGYLVSPRDLTGISFMPELRRIGIDSYKIEGRLKSPEYVAAAVKLYSGGGSRLLVQETFLRGDHTGWLGGVDHKKLVDPKINSHTGVYLGEVDQIISGEKKIIYIFNQTPLPAKGDGVAFFNPDTGERTGGPVYGVEQKGRRVELSLARDFSFKQLTRGMKVYLTSSVEGSSLLFHSFHDKDRKKKISIDFSIELEVGKIPCLSISDGNHRVEICGDLPVEVAGNRPLTEEAIINELSGLGGSIYRPGKMDVKVGENLFYHNKELRRMKNRGLTQLDLLRRGVEENRAGVVAIDPTDQLLAPVFDALESYVTGGNQEVRINLLLRSPEQVGQLLSNKEIVSVFSVVYLDFPYGKDYRPAVEKLRDAGVTTGIGTPRVMKPGEEHYLDKIIELSPEQILVRNPGSIVYLKDKINQSKKPISLIGDFSLNITNSATALFYLEQGLERLTPSYDLISDFGQQRSIANLADFLRGGSASRTEVLLYYYLPSFYMEYCLYADHLGKGGDQHSCGYPCKRHHLSLHDRLGFDHPVVADQQCRNTMYNGAVRGLFGDYRSLYALGVRDFRVELLPGEKELERAYSRVVSLYRKGGAV